VYLRGDISILVPAVFSEIVAILNAPAVLADPGENWNSDPDPKHRLSETHFACNFMEHVSSILADIRRGSPGPTIVTRPLPVVVMIPER
jgi:hypothetical protein